MKNFKGTINGTSYTDKDEFMKSLAELQDADDIAVKCEEEETNENADWDELLAEYKKSFENILTSFNHLLDYHDFDYHDLEERCDKKHCDYKKEIETKNYNNKPDNTIPKIKTLYDLKAAYFYDETHPHKFVGEKKEDIELDKIDHTLLELERQWEETDFDEFENEIVLKQALEDKYTHYATKKRYADNNAHNIDEEIAILEKVVILSNKVNLPNKEAEQKLAELQTQFDATQNAANYYSLLTEYYANLLRKL